MSCDTKLCSAFQPQVGTKLCSAFQSIAAILNGRPSLVIINGEYESDDERKIRMHEKRRIWRRMTKTLQLEMAKKKYYKIVPCPSYRMLASCNLGNSCLLIHSMSEARCLHCLSLGKHLTVNCPYKLISRAIKF